MTAGKGGPYSRGMGKNSKKGRQPQAETISRESVREERHPEQHAQGPKQALKKVAEEARGKPLPTRAKKALQEVDREIAGTYEAREDAETRSS